MTRRTPRAFLLAILLLTGIHAWAQDDPCSGYFDETIKESQAPGGVFARLYHQPAETSCILGSSDTTGIEALYRLMFDDSRSVEETTAARDRMFELVLDDLGRGVCPGGEDDCPIDRQERTVRDLRSQLVDQAAGPDPSLVDVNRWKITPRGKIPVNGIDLMTSLTEACQPGTDSEPCKTEAMNAARIMRSSGAMFQAIAAYRRPAIESHADFLSKRDEEWSTYFNKISVQYPWEMIFNGQRYRKNHTPNELALFPRAPSGKHILAHPSVGFEWIDSPMQTESPTPAEDAGLEAVVLLELYGYERWSWNDGEAKNRWGGSVVASFADISGMDEIGWGVVLHTPMRNISIGAVHRDGVNGSKTGIFMNADLAKLFKKYRDRDVKEFLEGEE